MPKKWVIAANGDPTNEPPWDSTLKIETGAENIMPTPLTGGQEISFAPQMIFLGLRPGGWAKYIFIGNICIYVYIHYVYVWKCIQSQAKHTKQS